MSLAQAVCAEASAVLKSLLAEGAAAHTDKQLEAKAESFSGHDNFAP